MWMQWWPRMWPVDRHGGPTSQRSAEDAGTASPGRPPTAARVLAEIRTWGYFREVPATLVSGQSWRDLAGWWRISNVALATEPSLQRKLHWVMLRAAILDEMEATDPEGFPKWLARQHPGRRRPRRS